MMYIRDLIRKKRDKQELTQDEARFFIFSYFKNEILNEQAAALLTLMYTNGITSKEMAYLTKAMAETGVECELYKISNRIVDIHPIGGMDDKIIIMLNAIIASLGIPICKTVGREIGILDKLNKIKTYQLENDLKSIQQSTKNKEITIIKEPYNIAPVENKLYKLRNDIACNDDPSLIAMNLMSQKLAIGVRNIVFDISYGESAYIKTYQKAKILSKYLVQLGRELERNVKCIITKLDEPVGHFFGSQLETEEILKGLQGEMEEDVKELLLELGNNVLMLSDKSTNTKENKRKILEVIRNGQAYEKLLNALPNYNYQKANHIIPVMSKEDGYVKEINVSKIRVNAKYLNAIRHNKDDILDISAGIQLNKKIGEQVNIGEILGYINTNDETKIANSVEMLKNAFVISNQKVKKTSRIVGNIF